MRALPGLAVVALMGLAGCASMVNITPSASNAQRLTYDSGKPRLTSVKTFTVVLQVKSTVFASGNPVGFVVAVFNPTSVPVEVSTDNVTATWTGTPLKVYSFEELMAEEQRRQSTQRIGLALQGFGAGVSGDTGAVDARIRSFKAESAAVVGQLEQTIFRRHTVATNTTYAGVIVITTPSEIRKAERILVSVTIQNDAHVFALDLTPMKSH